MWEAKEIGSGFSTPSVVADRLYLLGNNGLDDEFVAALSVSDGKPLWTARLGRVGNPDQQPNYPAARSIFISVCRLRSSAVTIRAVRTK